MKSRFKVDDIVYNKRTKNIGIVRLPDDRYGEVKTDADGNVDVDELEIYNPTKFKHQKDGIAAPSTKKEIDNRGLYNPFKLSESKKSFKLKSINEYWEDSPSNFNQGDMLNYYDDETFDTFEDDYLDEDEFQSNKEISTSLEERIKDILSSVKGHWGFSVYKEPYIVTGNKSLSERIAKLLNQNDITAKVRSYKGSYIVAIDVDDDGEVDYQVSEGRGRYLDVSIN